MNPVSPILTALALKKYNEAKAEYLAASQEDNSEQILATINQYKDDMYFQLDQYDKTYGEIENPGLMIVPMIKCGMMVGKTCRIAAIIGIKNTRRDQEIYIKDFEWELSLLGEKLHYLSRSNKMGDIIKLQPNVYTQFEMIPLKLNVGEKYYSQVNNPMDYYNSDSHGGMNFLNVLSFGILNASKKSLMDVYSMTDALKAMRKEICDLNGYRQSSSIGLCKKTTVTGVGYMENGNLYYGGKKPIVSCDFFCNCRVGLLNENPQGIVNIHNIPGSFKYMGEAYYPYRKIGDADYIESVFRGGYTNDDDSWIKVWRDKGYIYM